MFIAELFTIAKTWKQPKCPLTDEWIKMWYIYTMEYYSTVKRKKLLIHTPWLNLKDIILSKRSQMSKSKYCLIQFI